MYSKRWVQILFVALSILIATRASWFHHHDVGARQVSSSSAVDDTEESAVSTAAETSIASTTSDAATTSEAETTAEPSSTSSDEPSSTTDEPTTSDTPTPSISTTTSESDSPTTTSSSDTGPITSAPTSDSTSSAVPTTSSDGAGDNSDTETSEDTKSTKSTTEKPVTKTTTIFHTSTDDSGQTHVESSESVVVSTPGFSGSDGGSGNGNSGVTPTQRNIIIGVTVGVGGAIILAAGGILFWRLRNKRRSQEENEELISYGAGFGGPGTAEKSEASGPSGGARSPFQSTLETYHAPTQTNAASNF
ncbi:hypothetical protein F5X98DRAFT_323392 [Xylaria grammica]|nr:hypothetical protein F5X98DRAFT_323392 [Xylaria grammica]